MQLFGTLPAAMSLSQAAPAHVPDQYRPGMIVGPVRVSLVNGPTALRLMSNCVRLNTVTSTIGAKPLPWNEPVSFNVR